MDGDVLKGYNGTQGEGIGVMVLSIKHFAAQGKRQATPK